MKLDENALKSACERQNRWRDHRNSIQCRKTRKSNDSTASRRLNRIAVLMVYAQRKNDYRNPVEVAIDRAYRKSIAVE